MFGFLRTRKNRYIKPRTTCFELGEEQAKKDLSKYRDNIKKYMISSTKSDELNKLKDEFINLYNNFNSMLTNREYNIAITTNTDFSIDQYINSIIDPIINYKDKIDKKYYKLTKCIKKLEYIINKPIYKTRKVCKDDGYNNELLQYKRDLDMDFSLNTTPQDTEAYLQRLLIIKESKNGLYQIYIALYDLSKKINKYLRLNAGKSRSFSNLFSSTHINPENVPSLYKNLFRAIEDAVAKYKDFKENNLKCIESKTPVYNCDPTDIKEVKKTNYTREVDTTGPIYFLVFEELGKIQRKLISIHRKDILDSKDMENIKDAQDYIEHLDNDHIDNENKKLISNIQQFIDRL
jgi:hypothetical protein